MTHPSGKEIFEAIRDASEIILSETRYFTELSVVVVLGFDLYINLRQYFNQLAPFNLAAYESLGPGDGYVLGCKVFKVSKESVFEVYYLDKRRDDRLNKFLCEFKRKHNSKENHEDQKETNTKQKKKSEWRTLR